MRSSSVVPVYIPADIEEAVRRRLDQRVVSGRFLCGIVFGDAAPRLRTGHQGGPRLLGLAECVEFLEQPVVQVGDVVVGEAGVALRRAHARHALARTVAASQLGAEPMCVAEARRLCEALLAGRDRRVELADEAVHDALHVRDGRVVEPFVARELDAAQGTRLVLEGAVQACEFDQEARVVRMRLIDEPQRGVGEMLLADFDQHARDLEDLPGARTQGALAGLERVERRFAREARGMAGLRQHGVRHRTVRRMADQFDAQHFRLAEALLPEMVDGLLPQGLEIGLLHDGHRSAAGAGAIRS